MHYGIGDQTELFGLTLVFNQTLVLNLAFEVKSKTMA